MYLFLLYHIPLYGFIYYQNPILPKRGHTNCLYPMLILKTAPDPGEELTFINPDYENPVR